MSSIKKKIESLHLKLQDPKPPVGNYIGSRRVGELLYASGRVSDLAGEIGTDISLESAKQAAKDTVLLILAIVNKDIVDLDLLTGVVKVQGFLRCAPGFTELPKVLDGASDLLIEIFGENGRHARTATGVSQLPFGAALQVDIIFEMRRK